MWDSQKRFGAKWVPKEAFQFSMWDSIKYLGTSSYSITFNSLCEIHRLVYERCADASQYFQFSMWDSRRSLCGWRGNKPVFQFSMWDSSASVGGFRVIRYDFQFSMWDSSSTHKGFGEGEGGFQFSMWDSPLLSQNKATRRENFFQFSMWDSCMCHKGDC